MQNSDHLLIVSGLSCISVFMPFFFVVCNIGENVTTAFNSINSSVYAISWYNCPVRIQKYLLPIILITEEPVRIPVFGSIDCCRETFKGVSYKMARRFIRHICK